MSMFKMVVIDHKRKSKKIALNNLGGSLEKSLSECQLKQQRLFANIFLDRFRVAVIEICC